MDRVVYVWTNRPDPEAKNNYIWRHAGERSVPGLAANVAANISRYGAITHLYGLIGSDHEGIKLSRMIMEKCTNEREPIFLKHAVQGNRTIVKTRYYDKKTGERLQRFDIDPSEEEHPSREDKIELQHENDFNTSFLENLEKYDAVILSDYDKLVFRRNLAQRIINACKSSNIPVFADPKPENARLGAFNGATLICPNLDEARKIVGESYNGLENLTKKLRELTETEIAVVKSGADGSYIYDGKRFRHIPAYSFRKVVDPTAAGDTYIANFALAMISYPPDYDRDIVIQNSGKLASLSAGLTVEKSGTHTNSATELVERIEEAAKRQYELKA